MSVGEPHKNPPQRMVPDRDRFLGLTRQLLVKLRDEILESLRSHELEELQMLDGWRRSIPPFCSDILGILFTKLPELPEAFDLKISQRDLYTLDNLEALVEENGADEVANRFVDYFASHMAKRWCVLVKAENLAFDEGFPELNPEDEPVSLRKLKEEEKTLFRKRGLPSKWVDEDALYFAIEVQAGHEVKAIEKARDAIHRFLAPFYLHRMLNPDEWWRPRTQRNILSPMSFVYSSRPEETAISTHRELRQLRSNACELFFPSPEIPPDWKEAVQSLAHVWHETPKDLPELERCLRLCARWMFAAEVEEDLDGAFLKHCVTWQALLPRARRPRIGWYLLLLCIGSADPLCIRTVSQAERLLDRRNSIAHPEERRGLWENLEKELYVLKQSLRRAFDSALQIRQRAERCGMPPPDWGKLLRGTFHCLCSKNVRQAADQEVLYLLSDLHLLNGNANQCSRDFLNQEGCTARAEALAVKARECWEKDPKGCVRHLARAYTVAKQRCLPDTRLHITLWAKKRLEEMDEQEFDEAWSASGVGIRAPSRSDLDLEIDRIHRDYGLCPEAVGWNDR